MRAGRPLAALLASGCTVTLALWAWSYRHRTPVAAPILVTVAYRTRVDTLRPGETLTDLFQRHHVGPAELIRPMRDLAIEPRRLRAGLVFHFRERIGQDQPASVEVRTGPGERLRFVHDSLAWRAIREPIHWTTEIIRVSGGIDNSLYEALDAQIPDGVLKGEERVRLAWDLADVYMWQVDFTKDIQPADRFTVVLERKVSEEGEYRFGRILASELAMSGKQLSAFRFESADGHGSFYDRGAMSLRRAFLRSPVEFRRISSVFAHSRYHPVLGIWRKHEGTDYAAAPGTPVHAAGNGTVVLAGRLGGYGNLVELRHVNGITTRYGHLKSFARGMHSGMRVTQGDVIGYVGATGLASGPHLHYEFRVRGAAKDSRRVALGEGEPIEPRLRDAFQRERTRLESMLTSGGPTRALVRLE